MTLTRRTWLHLSALWLSLAIVLGHALLPPGPWLHGRSGSAFSVFTIEPVLGHGRDDQAAEQGRVRADRDGHGLLGDADPPILAAIAPALPQPSASHAPPEIRPAAFASRDAPLRYQARAPPRA